MPFTHQVYPWARSDALLHGGISLEQKAALSMRGGQLRLSVGIEDIDDILADLAQALVD